MAELEVEKHVKYIISVEKKKDDFESVVMEHLRLNGAYWGLTALDILGKLNVVDQDEVVSWVMQCQHESGGFGGNIGHDPHLLFTLSAIQVLALFDKMDILDIEKVSNYIASLQNEDGSFSGDMWGEVDTRFSYIAICSLALLNRMEKVNVDRAVQYIVSCKNLDGGFGCTPGAESHAGQIFCCVGALAITGSLHHVDKDLLGWWLCERQVKSGGLNGRPEKLPDVCYSWWVLSSLIMIDRVHWIDKEKLVRFILDCQDKDNGGISDRPDDAVDVFHTYFGVAEQSGGNGDKGGGDAMLPCVQKLLPCQATLVSRSKNPPATCCVPLKQIIQDDPKCLCDVFNNPVLLKGLNITQDDALDLPKNCHSNADISICNKLPGNPPASSPVTPSPPTASTSNGSSSTATPPSKSAAVGSEAMFGETATISLALSLLLSSVGFI